MQTIEDITES
jgi:hypothetical protein